MIITCPQCSTKYDVSPQAFRPDGKKVKCTSCSTEWHVAPPGKINQGRTSSSDDLSNNKKSNIHESNSLDRNHNQKDKNNRFNGKSSFKRNKIEFKTLLKSINPYYKINNILYSSFVLNILFALLFLGSLFGNLIYFRTHIVKNLPGAERYYRFLGFEINIRGVEFQEVKYEKELQDMLPVLVVRGNMVNVSNVVEPLVRLRFGLIDSNGKERYHWYHDLKRKSIKTGEIVPFKTKLISPPENISAVSVRFDTVM